MMLRPELLDIGYLLVSANRALAARTHSAIRDLGLTPQQGLMLLAISEQQDQGITPGQIGEFMGADSPTISGIIGRLERAGYITTDRNPCDRRSRIVKLTAQAEAIVPDVRQIVLDAGVWASSLMEPDDIDQLKRLLEMLIERAEKSLDAP